MFRISEALIADLHLIYAPSNPNIAMKIQSSLNKHPNFKVFIATQNSRLVAYVAILIMDNIAHEHKPSAMITDLFIEKDVDYSYIKKQLLAYCMDYSVQHGCFKLVIADSKLFLPESTGFEERGVCFSYDLSANPYVEGFSLNQYASLSIQEAEMSDLESILRLYETDLDYKDGLNRDESRLYFQKINGYPDYKLYITKKDGEICGSFALLMVPTLRGNMNGLAIIENVVVAKKYQGNGIGKQIMSAAIVLSESAQCKQLILSSSNSRPKAHDFYKKLGFKASGLSFNVQVQLPVLYSSRINRPGPRRCVPDLFFLAQRALDQVSKINEENMRRLDANEQKNPKNTPG